MESIRNLTQEEVKYFASNPTTSSTLDTDTVIMEQWTNDVIIKARKILMCDQFLGQRYNMGQGGDTLHVIRQTDMNDGSAMTSSWTEGSASINTYEVNFDAKDITGTMYGIGIELTGQALDEAHFNARELCTQALAYQLGKVRDTAIYNALVPAGASIDSSTNEIWAGSATSDIQSTDTLVLNDFPDALHQLRLDNIPEPYSCLATPYELNYFQKSSQFVNAAERGSSAVIENGKVTRYLNCDIAYTNNHTPRTSSDTDFSANGHDVLICSIPLYMAVGTWRPLTMGIHYHPQDDKTYIVGTWDEGYKAIQPEAACIVHTADW